MFFSSKDDEALAQVGQGSEQLDLAEDVLVYCRGDGYAR